MSKIDKVLNKKFSCNGQGKVREFHSPVWVATLSYFILVPTFAINLRPQNENEDWGTSSKGMSSCGFSVSEENACLMLCIAARKNVQEMQTIFLITVDKNCAKVEDNIWNCFHLFVEKKNVQGISEFVTGVAASQCFCH